MNRSLVANPAILAQYQAKADAMKESCLKSGNTDFSSITGTCYYISENGDDANDGLTTLTPIRTLERVNALSLQSGDAVLFRRGDMFRGTVVACSGVLYSAYGEGAKPVICASVRNYADPALWVESALPDVWRCTLPLNNVGLLTFDHDPRTVGKYDARLGWLQVGHVPDGYRHLEQAEDLDFWCDVETQTLYLKCVGLNPGERFKQIEIAENVHAFKLWNGVGQVTIDNLHITLCGGHGVSGMMNVYGLEVRNCVFDYIGGSLWRYLIRYGNAVEIFGSCHGYHVYNNWIYQIYDTGITHQCNDCKDLDVTQEDVEYHDNLIEYCFWSIEYYNQRNRFGITRNIYVHDNFCRFGGEGWGCRIRKKIPMYSFAEPAQITENYRTENNIFETASRYVYHHSHYLEPEGALSFRGNTYLVHAGCDFALWGKDNVIPLSGAADFLEKVLREKDYTLITVE